MRKALYISISISLIIVGAALVHHNWRAQQLREQLAEVPDSDAAEQESPINAPVASNVGGTAGPLSFDTVAPVETEAFANATEAELGEIFAEYDRMNEAYEKEKARHEAEMASLQHGREDIQRRIAEGDARIAMREAKRAAKREVDASYADINLPPEMIKAIEEAHANEESLRRVEAQHGGLRGFVKYLVRKHFPDLPEPNLPD